MRKNKEKMIALGMCAVLIASSLNLGGAYGNAFQVQAAELGLSEEASEESENAKATEASQKPENGEIAELTEKSGDTQLPKPQSQPTAQEGEPEEPEDAMPEGASQLQEVAAPEELSGNSDGVEQEDISQVLEDAAANGNSQLLENETAGEPAGEELLESEGMAQDGFLAPAGLETKDGIEPFAETDGSIAIDETNFPDAYFREYLLGTLSGYESVGIDADGDGMLSAEERNQVTSISIEGKPIRDFTGISYFPNLEGFRATECLVSSVDFSGNAELKNVYLYNNQKLVSVDLSGNAKLTYISLNSNEKMEHVKLSGCSQLTYLSLYGGALSGLDLSGCSQLEFLDCGSNQLGALDLSPVTQLKSLDVSSNQLEILDLSSFEQLQSLDVYNNQLKTLDLSSVGQLESLDVSSNQLETLELQYNQKLVRLECSQNRLKKLDIAGLPSLENLYCPNNKLVELNVRDNLNLSNIVCYNNPLRSLDISQNLKLESLNIDNTYITALDTSENELLRLNSFGWSTAQITSVAERLEDGRWLLDLSSQEGFQPDKLLLEESDVSGAVGITEQGIVWEENPAQNGNVNISVNYDLSNGGYLDGKVIRCNYTLLMLPEGYDKTYVDLTADNFPDEAFRNFLKENYDQDNDGQFQPGMVSNLGIYEIENLTDLAGLEYFKALTNLTVSGSPSLSKLDVSKNEQLTYLYLDRTSIHSLDLRSNPNMSELYGDLQLTSLYVAEDNIGFSYYSGTSITATAIEENGRFVLDMSEYGGLDMNRIIRLSGGEADGDKIYWDAEDEIPMVLSYEFILRVDYEEGVEYSGNDVLRVMVSLTNNAPEMPEGKEIALTEENFPSTALLEYLKEWYNDNGKVNTANVTDISLGGAEITSLEGIEKLNCLQTLSIWNTPLRSLNLSSNTVLTSLSVTESSLTDIHIDGCPYLEYVSFSGNSLTSLDVSQNKILRTLNVWGNSLINLDVSQNKNLKDLNVNENAIKSLDLSCNSNLQVLSCSYNPAMASLNFPAQKGKMSELHVLGCSIQNLQIENMPNLTVLEIDSNGGKIGEVDLAGNIKLKSIRAYDISVKADWPKMADLEWIEMQNMQMPQPVPRPVPGTIESSTVDESNSDILLEEMDLSNAANLQYCHVRMDSLGTLDVHGGTNLQDLSVGGGRLQMLNIAGCVALVNLDCSYNHLQTLDISSCTALKSLNCSRNELQVLDIRNNGALQNLYCHGNNLSTIDTSQNAALKWFECSGNPIVSLDLSNNKAMLSTLYCNNASLTSLDVGENMALESVSLGNQVFKVSESDLQQETNVAKAASSSAVQPSITQNLRAAGTGKYILRLDQYGNFDPSKVKNLTSGTAVANGIMWESKDAVPDVVQYDYDISNQYKLDSKVMPVQIVFNEGEYGQPDGTITGEYGQPDGTITGEYGQPDGTITGEYGRPNGIIPIQKPSKSLSTCTITFNTKSSSYTGRTQTPKVVVKDRGYTLKPGTDYILNYKNNINAGNASIILKGTGNYTGDVRKNFTIKKAQQKIRCTKSFQKTYGSKAFPLKAKRASGNGRLSYSTSDKRVATVSKNGKVTLKGAGIATITIKAAATKNYKAASVKVKVTVKPAKVAVTSLKTMKGKKLSVKWKKAPNATGYEIQYSTDKKFKKGVKQIKIAKGKATSCTLKKLKDNKKYYVRIRAYKAVKVKGKKQTLKGAWGTVRGSKKIGTIGESSEIKKSNQQNKIIQQMENRSK